MSDQKPEARKRIRPSFVWPIILITIGVLFLLYNLRVVQGDFWNIVWQWWPVLLIAIGLDSLFRRNEIAGPVFLIGLGVVILLSSLGWLGYGTWSILWRLWPVLLVSIGLEIIIGRKSLLLSFLVVVVILLGLGLVLWGFGVDQPLGDALRSSIVNQELGDIKSAEIRINPAVGNLIVNELQGTTTLIQGEINARGKANVFTDFQDRGESGYYKIENRPFNNIPFSSAWFWDLGISGTIPIEFYVSMGVGDMNLDLAELDLSGVEIRQGVGDITLVLHERSSYAVQVSQAIGSITIRIPPKTGVRIQVDRAIANLDLPAGYEQDGEYYYSPGYGSIEHKIELHIKQAIGDIEILE